MLYSGLERSDISWFEVKPRARLARRAASIRSN
jgi:hypothetical protein